VFSDGYRATTAMTTTAHPLVVPDGELLVLGSSRDTNVVIATVHCGGNGCAGELSMLRYQGFHSCQHNGFKRPTAGPRYKSVPHGTLCTHRLRSRLDSIYKHKFRILQKTKQKCIIVLLVECIVQLGLV
jgi:hypothetical protein